MNTGGGGSQGLWKVCSSEGALSPSSECTTYADVFNEGGVDMPGTLHALQTENKTVLIENSSGRKETYGRF